MAGAKIVTWFFWTANLVTCGLYSTAAIWTFKILLKSGLNMSWSSKYALLFSCLLGPIVVDTWVIISFFVLLSHSWSNSPLGYGFMLGTALHTSVFMVLAGLMLNSSSGTISSLRSKGVFSTLDYNVYTTAYVMSYILAGVYLFLFIILFGLRRRLSGGDPVESKPLRTHMHSHSDDAITGIPTRDSAKPEKPVEKKKGLFGRMIPEAKPAPPPPPSLPATRTNLQYSTTSKGLSLAKIGSLGKSTGMGPSKGGAYV